MMHRRPVRISRTWIVACNPVVVEKAGNSAILSNFSPQSVARVFQICHCGIIGTDWDPFTVVTVGAGEFGKNGCKAIEVQVICENSPSVVSERMKYIQPEAARVSASKTDTCASWWPDCKRRASHERSLTQPSLPRVLVSEAVACVAAPTAHVPRAATSTALRWPSSSFLPFLLSPLTSSLSLLPSTFSPHVCFRGWSRA